ncbi:PDZ domain-containing protein 11 [Bos mutus]|uniref:PDZ domain-containing protein 11 n=1 Tax=Bos mutus TaxID=72004 RepID=L8IHM5_9CETA|nr:PDZ domain-containing protein 11 [Bos mutus]
MPKPLEADYAPSGQSCTRYQPEFEPSLLHKAFCHLLPDERPTEKQLNGCQPAVSHSYGLSIPSNFKCGLRLQFTRNSQPAGSPVEARALSALEVLPVDDAGLPGPFGSHTLNQQHTEAPSDRTSAQGPGLRKDKIRKGKEVSIPKRRQVRSKGFWFKGSVSSPRPNPPWNTVETGQTVYNPNLPLIPVNPLSLCACQCREGQAKRQVYKATLIRLHTDSMPDTVPGELAPALELCGVRFRLSTNHPRDRAPEDKIPPDETPSVSLPLSRTPAAGPGSELLLLLSPTPARARFLAAGDPRLQEGDQVLAVKDVDFQNAEHSKATEILKTAEPHLIHTQSSILVTQTVKNPRTKHPSKGPPLAFFLCDSESIGPSSPLISSVLDTEDSRQLEGPAVFPGQGHSQSYRTDRQTHLHVTPVQGSARQGDLPEFTEQCGGQCRDGEGQAQAPAAWVPPQFYCVQTPRPWLVPLQYRGPESHHLKGLQTTAPSPSAASSVTFLPKHQVTPDFRSQSQPLLILLSKVRDLSCSDSNPFCNFECVTPQAA